jgi:hypothetical protein
MQGLSQGGGITDMQIVLDIENDSVKISGTKDGATHTVTKQLPAEDRGRLYYDTLDFLLRYKDMPYDPPRNNTPVLDRASNT